MERRVARLEFAEGALVRLRIPVSASDADDGRDVLTDIDVLSIDLDRRLRVTRSSMECKSGKGQKGEPYTIVWLAGFRELLKLDQVTIVRQTISARGRALARQLGIRVLDGQTLEQREAGHAWVPQSFAHLDGAACSAAESQTDEQIRAAGVPSELARFLRGEGLLTDSHSLLASVVAFGNVCRALGPLPDPSAKVMAGHCLMAVTLAALEDAGRLDEVPARSLKERLTRALTVGDPDDTHLLPLLERADDLVRYLLDRTHRQYVEAGAEPQRTPLPSLRDALAAPPDFLDDYVDFVLRLRANPQVARDLLQTVELACFEALLGGHEWTQPAFRHLFTAEHRGFLGVAVRCLRSVAGNDIAAPLDALAPVLRLVSETDVPDRRSPMAADAVKDQQQEASEARTHQAPLFGGDEQRT